MCILYSDLNCFYLGEQQSLLGQKFLMKISKSPSYEEMLLMLVFFYFFGYFIMFLHHSNRQTADCKNWNIFMFTPITEKFGFSPLVIAFGYRLSVEKRFWGGIKNSTIPSLLSVLYTENYWQGFNNNPPSFPPSLQEKKEKIHLLVKEGSLPSISPPLTLLFSSSRGAHHWNIILQKYQRQKIPWWKKIVKF